MHRPHAFVLAALLTSACSTAPTEQPAPGEARPTEVLIFTKTVGHRHDSIPEGIACMSDLAGQLGLTPRATEDSAEFTDEVLADVAAVVFLSTTQDVLDEAGQGALERYIQGGGGWVGVHAATDTEYDWPWYTGLAGAQFESHPAIQRAQLWRCSDHASVAFLPEPWVRTDEWYNFKEMSDAVTPILMLDEASYEGGTNGDSHPAAWYHEYDGGRAWYTAGGHTKESFGEELFRKHLLEGLRWASGDGLEQ